jgi:hypothetical protein
MKDFLGLDQREPPKQVVEQAAERSRVIAALNRRITQGDYADSLEVKIALLSHLIVTVWQDLKEGS